MIKSEDISRTLNWVEADLMVASLWLVQLSHMGCPVRLVKGQQRPPEALSLPINRPTDQNSF